MRSFKRTSVFISQSETYHLIYWGQKTWGDFQDILTGILIKIFLKLRFVFFRSATLYFEREAVEGGVDNGYKL